MQAFLVKLRLCLALSPSELGCTTLVRYKIDTGSHAPVRHNPRRVSASERTEIKTQVEDMLQRGIISRSYSRWSLPVVLVKKMDGTTRVCVDCRRLNSITKPDVYPLPRLDDALDRLYGAKYFTTLGLLSGYWQVDLEDEAEKTALITPDGLHHFNRLLFGLSNAFATFQRLMDRVLRHLN